MCGEGRGMGRGHPPVAYEVRGSVSSAAGYGAEPWPKTEFLCILYQRNLLW